MMSDAFLEIVLQNIVKLNIINKTERAIRVFQLQHEIFFKRKVLELMRKTIFYDLKTRSSRYVTID